METITLNQVLTEVIGVTVDQLDTDQPIDMVMREMAAEYARQQNNIIHHAAGVRRTLDRALSASLPSPLAADSATRDYDAAVARLEGANHALAVAAAAWRMSQPEHA